MDWHELQKHKVNDLRDMAHEKGHTSTSGLSKDQLVEWLAHELGIEKPHLVAEGINKSNIKQKIRGLQGDVAEAIVAKDRKLTRQKRRQIHRLKRKIRRAAHLTH